MVVIYSWTQTTSGYLISVRASCIAVVLMTKVGLNVFSSCVQV